jgi:hypothetical protein
MIPKAVELPVLCLYRPGSESASHHLELFVRAFAEFRYCCQLSTDVSWTGQPLSNCAIAHNRHTRAMNDLVNWCLHAPRETVKPCEASPARLSLTPPLDDRSAFQLHSFHRLFNSVPISSHFFISLLPSSAP